MGTRTVILETAVWLVTSMHNILSRPNRVRICKLTTNGQLPDVTLKHYRKVKKMDILKFQSIAVVVFVHIFQELSIVSARFLTFLVSVVVYTVLRETLF